MNDQELRTLVRDAIARHTGQRGADDPPMPGVIAIGRVNHPSHALYQLNNVTDACVIEPSVRCNHCGYCKSHGH